MLPLIVLMVLASTTAQKSPYFPSRTYPGLLPRFRQQEQEAGLDNRNGVPEAEPTTISPELQGTLHEDKVVQRVAEWPEDRQPFWFKNREVLNNQRQHSVDGASDYQQSWGGRTNRRPVNWGNQNNQRPPVWENQNNPRPVWGNQNTQVPVNGGRRPTQQGIINSGQRSGAGNDQEYENV